jgi:hypothetical protein
VAPVAGLLSAFWVLPFVARRDYLNDMGWEKIEPWSDHSLLSFAWLARVGDSLWHEDIRWFVAFALIGAVVAVVERDRNGGFLAVMAVLFAVAFVVAPQGRLWNARLLPFYYLMIYLLAGYAAAEICRAVARQFARRGERAIVPARALAGVGLGVALLVAVPRLAEDAGRAGSVVAAVAEVVGLAILLAVVLDLVRGVLRTRSRIEVGIGGVTALAVVAVVGIVVALPLGSLPGGSSTASGGYRWLGLETSAEDLSFVDGWARWNYQGYERKAGNDSGGGYEEYHGIVTTMADIGEDRGCGRAMWEYEPELDRYGTPMALMLLPFWTDGCIGSMEGLFFEASATTPYHFLNQSELSADPSRAQRELPYDSFDIDEGIEHLQLMGVRYYLAFSETALDAARGHPDLTEIASSAPWTVFEVDGADLVAPLDFEPAVLDGVSDAGGEWLEPSTDWYTDADARRVLLASSGPQNWDRVEPGQTPTEVAVDPVVVSAIDAGDDSISFDVDRVGRPVLVKTSYFPNWEADGADGPYRVTPNLMVVVPTAEHVELRYGTTPVDVLAWVLTGLGLVALVVLVRRPPLSMPVAAPAVDRDGGDPRPDGVGSVAPDPDPGPSGGDRSSDLEPSDPPEP